MAILTPASPVLITEAPPDSFTPYLRGRTPPDRSPWPIHAATRAHLPCYYDQPSPPTPADKVARAPSPAFRPDPIATPVLPRRVAAVSVPPPEATPEDAGLLDVAGSASAVKSAATASALGLVPVHPKTTPGEHMAVIVGWNGQRIPGVIRQLLARPLTTTLPRPSSLELLVSSRMGVSSIPSPTPAPHPTPSELTQLREKLQQAEQRHAARTARVVEFQAALEAEIDNLSVETETLRKVREELVRHTLQEAMLRQEGESRAWRRLSVDM